MNTIRKYTTNNCLMLLVLLLVVVLVWRRSQESDLIEGFQAHSVGTSSVIEAFQAAPDATSLGTASIAEAYENKSENQKTCCSVPPSLAYSGSPTGLSFGQISSSRGTGSHPIEMMVGVSTEQCRSFWVV